MRKTYLLEDLDCATCALKIQDSVEELDCVTYSRVTLITQKLVIETTSNDMPGLLKEIKRIVKSYEPDVTVIEK